MLKKLLPIVFLFIGVGGGIGAGVFLAPKPPATGDETQAGQSNHGGDASSEQDTSHGDDPPKKKESAGGETSHGEEGVQPDTEYVKLSNQFVVPIVKKDRIEALVVISLSLETKYGLKETVYAHEPKLRDVFLQVLFDHANMGGFNGAFTRSEMLELLRGALRDVAKRELGKDVLNVLIVDIVRQDT